MKTIKIAIFGLGVVGSHVVKLLEKKFSPYCSVATGYLWRSIDPEPIQY